MNNKVSISDKLQKFLLSSNRNEWLSDGKMKVYVRKSKRCFDGVTLLTCFDCATVEVEDKGKGTFKKFIKEFHEINPFQASFIESVCEPRLAEWCEKNNWTKFRENNYYLIKGK